MNTYVKDSKIIKQYFNVSYLNLYSAKNVNKIYYTLFTIFNLLKNITILITKLIFFRPTIVYFTISPVNSFYRDLFYVIILKIFNNKILYHLHGKGIWTYSSKTKLNYLFYKWAYNKVNVICISELLRNDIRSIYHGYIYILPNGIPNMDSMQLFTVCNEVHFNSTNLPKTE